MKRNSISIKRYFQPIPDYMYVCIYFVINWSSTVLQFKKINE